MSILTVKCRINMNDSTISFFADMSALTDTLRKIAEKFSIWINSNAYTLEPKKSNAETVLETSKVNTVRPTIMILISQISSIS